MNIKQISFVLAALGSGVIVSGCNKNKEASEVPAHGAEKGEGSCGGEKAEASCSAEKNADGGGEPAEGEAAAGEGSCGGDAAEEPAEGSCGSVG